MEGGGEPEDQAAQARQAQCDEENVPVQLGVKREALLAVGEEASQQADAGNRDQDAERAGKKGEQNALGQELADQPEPSGADAETHRHLAAAGRGTCEQEVRRVRARDRQNQPHHDEQHIERLRVLPAQRVESPCAVLEAQLRKVRQLTRIRRG